ncbi:MAG: hypothetical protein ACREC0_11880 [Methylocella sp.]
MPIHKVTDLTLRGNAVERDLAMIKVMGKGSDRGEALRQAASDRRLDRELCVRAYRRRRQDRSVHRPHAADRSRRSAAHRRRRDVARAKSDARPRQPPFSFAKPISKNEFPLSMIRL